MEDKKENKPKMSAFADKRIRIVHLQLLALLTGVQRVSLDELTLLDRTQFEPYVICKEEGPFTQELEKIGIPFFCVPELVREISPFWDVKALFHLVSIFRKYHFDIVHTHSSKTGILGRFAGYLASVPIIIHSVHGYAFPAAKVGFQRKFYLLLEWVSAWFTDEFVLLNNNDFKITLHHLRVPIQKLHLIPNGVNEDKFSIFSHEKRKFIRRESLRLNEGEVAIGMVGRLWEQKNPECFVKAAIKLIQNGLTNIKFYLIGDGERKKNLEILIKESGLESEIQLLGWRNDVDKILGALDIFVLPSLWEGMPLAVLEAMSMSLPVVVSRIPGNTDLVDDGIEGYVFKSNDENELVEKLTLLINNFELREKMGKIGREKVLKKYTLTKRVKIMERLYLDGIKNNKLL